LSISFLSTKMRVRQCPSCGEWGCKRKERARLEADIRCRACSTPFYESGCPGCQTEATWIGARGDSTLCCDSYIRISAVNSLSNPCC